jgi:3-oxoacyl-[acyl-carrier-protein] synthase II
MLLADGRADAMVCLGVDLVPPPVATATEQIGLRAALPTTLAEAAVAVVLERASIARARGAKPLGALLGTGLASDAAGIGRADPAGGGAERAIRAALERSGRNPAEVRTVWTSRSGVARLDASETAAIGRVFGGGTCLAAPKLELGETMGASGMLHAILALLDRAAGDDAAQGGGSAGARSAGPGTVDLVHSASYGGSSIALALGSWA